MGSYNLESGEFAIMQTNQVRFGDDSFVEDLDELVLSNRNIIMVASRSVSLFKRTSRTYKLPLECIACPNGNPQVMTTRQGNGYLVQVVFETETIFFRFSEDHRRMAERWADGIRRAAVGDLAGIRTEDPAVPKELLDLADGAKQVFGAVFAAGASASGGTPVPQRIQSAPKKAQNTKARSKEKPPMVARKCNGCHASLVGRKGSITTCEYCGTRQTL